jgi:L-ascorbate metabolism protein UlaG (beta-lactamase superfamily)
MTHAHPNRTLNAVLLVALLCLATACAKPSVEVLAVANSGFLIRSSNHTVLVDALFRATAPYPKFAQQGPSENLIDLMVSGGGAFEHVDLVLITQAEADHFHAQTVVDFLASHGESVLVTTDEVAAALAGGAGYETIAPRVIVPSLDADQCTSIEAGGIPVSVCRTSRSGAETANNIYVVEIDGFTFLHEGDAEDTTETLSQITVPDGGLDVAFLHDRFVFDPAGRTILTEVIGARAVVLMHLRWDAAKPTRKRLAELDPEVVENLPPITVFGAETARSTFQPGK